MKRIKRISAILVLCTLLCLPELHAQISKSPVDTIPFELGADNRLYVTVYINGQDDRPLRFLLDTGATDVVLNSNSPRAPKGWLPLREVWRTIAPIRWKPFLPQSPLRW